MHTMPCSVKMSREIKTNACKNCLTYHMHFQHNPIKVAPYSLVQFINYLYRSATSDVILTTFAWNFRGSANILKQVAESCF